MQRLGSGRERTVAFDLAQDIEMDAFYHGFVLVGRVCLGRVVRK